MMVLFICNLAIQKRKVGSNSILVIQEVIRGFSSDLLEGDICFVGPVVVKN